MAIEAVASGVIHKVIDLLIQEPVIFVIEQVEDIRIALRHMRGFFIDAEELQRTDECAKKWVQDYLHTLYQVEDMVESHVTSLIKNYGSYLHGMRARQDLFMKMKKINEKIKRLQLEKPETIQDASLRGNSRRHEEEQFSVGNTTLVAQTKQTTNSSDEEYDSDLVGFKAELNDLENRLAGTNFEIIKVFGSLGSGKTALVKRMYDRKSIKKQFNCHAWLDVSEEHALKDLLLKIWHQVHNNRDIDLTVIEQGLLKDMLIKFLQTHKYLIVLDDAREQPGEWKELMDALTVFPSENGSKVILITREKAIAASYGRDSQPLCLGGLDDSNSLNHLLRALCIDNDSVFQHDTTLWGKILQKCNGSPLNLELLGGLLSTKNMFNKEWAQLLNHNDWHRSDIWLLSYNDLPAHYKLCLLYLALFPKDFDVSTRRILRLWLAEGFLRRSPGSPGLTEDLAEECFNYLVKRKLIKISKLRSDGGPKKCRLPGFLHENLSPKAQEISLFYIHPKSEAENIPRGCSGIRRIVEYADIKDYAPGPESKSDHLENLRSYLSFKFSRYDTPSIEVGNFLRKIIGKKGFGLLRVLDLEGVYKPMLPESLKHLFQLRYLGLRNTFLDSLPESIGNLPYLETLDLKRTYITNIPSSVWKLEHLRHLNLPQIRLDMSVQQLRSQLLTIWGLVIDDACNIVKGLSQRADLRELGITCQLKQSNDLMNWVASLTSLQSLSLISKDEMGQPFDLTLEPLQDLRKLSHLKLLGKLSHVLPRDQFPRNLKVLTLSLSQLNEDPMMVLSQLPFLSVLRLLAKSFVGKKMHCQQSGFKNLQALKLWMLEELEEWKVERGGMPNIRELDIRCCHKLKELPLELLQRTTLEELVLTTHENPRCMLELEQHINSNNSGRTISKINRYDFSLLPWEKDADLWNKSSKKN